MNPQTPNDRRADLQASLERDVSRHARREVGPRTFWRSLGVLGMVGWPVALGAAGGALFGRYLDHRWNAGIQCTLLLLTVGIVLGCFVAWRTVTRLHE